VFHPLEKPTTHSEDHKGSGREIPQPLPGRDLTAEQEVPVRLDQMIDRVHGEDPPHFTGQDRSGIGDGRDEKPHRQPHPHELLEIAKEDHRRGNKPGKAAGPEKL
jgi:hypothetical protein